MRFKIGVTCALDAPKGAPFPLVDPDIYATVDYLAENGFDSIELHLLHPGEVDAARIREYCAQKGIFISSIGTGMAYGREGLSLTSPDADVRRRAIERLKAQLDLASELECCIIIGSMHGNIPEGGSAAQTDMRMLEACKELAEHAEKGKGSIVIEAIDRLESNYLQTAAEVLELIEKTGSSRFYVHLDTYHMNMEERDWRAPVRMCGRRLGHVHVADNTRHYPGYGLIDFRPFLEALTEIGYEGSLTLECYPFPDGRTAVSRGLAHLRKLEAELGLSNPITTKE